MIHSPQRQPGPSVNQPPTSGARDRGEHHHCADEAHVAAAAPGRHDVGDDRVGQDHQSAAAQALHGAADDEPGHVAGEPADDRANDEDPDRGEEQALPADQVADLAVDRQGDRRGQEVRRQHPLLLIDAVQLADDGRQRGREDRRIEGSQELSDHKADEDEENAPRRSIGDPDR